MSWILLEPLELGQSLLPSSCLLPFPASEMCLRSSVGGFVKAVGRLCRVQGGLGLHRLKN